MLITGGQEVNDEGSVRVWEGATGKELFGRKSDSVTAVVVSPDGRIVASASHARQRGETIAAKPVIELRELATGEEILQWSPESTATSLAFSPDGNRLASGMQNSTVLIWDVEGRSSGRQPASLELKTLWSDLAREDAGLAHRAIRVLASVPEESTAFLKAQLKPASSVNAGGIRQLLGNLDSNEFTVRKTAIKELEDLNEEEEVRKILHESTKDKHSLEVNKRLQDLLARQNRLHAGEVLRGVRAVEVLEHIATPEAQKLLENLAGGAAEARLTQEAKAALIRLQGKAKAAQEPRRK